MQMKNQVNKTPKGNANTGIPPPRNYKGRGVPIELEPIGFDLASHTTKFSHLPIKNKFTHNSFLFLSFSQQPNRVYNKNQNQT